MTHRAYSNSIETTLNFIKVTYQKQVRKNIIHLLIDRRDFDGTGGNMDQADLKMLLDVLPEHEDFKGWVLVMETPDAYLLETSKSKYPRADMGSMMAAVVDATHMTVGAA